MHSGDAWFEWRSETTFWGDSRDLGLWAVNRTDGYVCASSGPDQARAVTIVMRPRSSQRITRSGLGRFQAMTATPDGVCR